MPSPSIAALLPITPRPLPCGAVETVDARDLHAFLCVGRDFSNWIKDRIATYGFEAGRDYVTDLSASFGEKGQGRPGIAYFLALDMAKELAMVERTPKGKEARAYFIECERIARGAAPTQHEPPRPTLPTTEQKLAIVREARLTFGCPTAQRIWRDLRVTDLPQPEQPAQRDMFEAPQQPSSRRTWRRITDEHIARIEARRDAGMTRREACEAEGVNFEGWKNAFYRIRRGHQQQH